MNVPTNITRRFLDGSKGNPTEQELQAEIHNILHRNALFILEQKNTTTPLKPILDFNNRISLNSATHREDFKPRRPAWQLKLEIRMLVVDANFRRSYGVTLFPGQQERLQTSRSWQYLMEDSIEMVREMERADIWEDGLYEMEKQMEKEMGMGMGETEVDGRGEIMREVAQWVQTAMESRSQSEEAIAANQEFDKWVESILGNEAGSIAHG